MNKFTLGLSAAALVCAGVASANAAAPVLVAGIYASTGSVTSTNGSSNCAAAGLTNGSPNTSVLDYPGAGKTGLRLYVPAAGLLQLCTGFTAIPAGGLNGYSSNAKCAIYSVNGNIPAENVNFSFKATTADANSGVGSTTIAIPATSPVGGGCTAVVTTSIVRTGK